MRLLASAFILICISNASYSQNSSSIGTFQLMTTNPKAQEIFTTDIIPIIEGNRQDDAVKILKINEFTWVRILSFNTINDASFTPLSDEIIVVDPNFILDNTTDNTSNH